MPKIPENVVQESVPGLELLRRGKVRDTYALPNMWTLLVVASDRLSIFDFVLPALVPEKGAVLTALNHFWRTRHVLRDLPQDLIASGAAIDEHLPAELRGTVELQSRATVVCRLDMIPCEAVVRGSLTGSGLAAYRETREICGHLLPDGLSDGDELPYPLFTPTTKAEVGHDEHVTADTAAMKWGVKIERLSLQLFTLAQKYARSRGIILADTKFEFGRDGSTGRFALGDEILTPDSSRFWDEREWISAQAKTPRRSPTAFDKQFVREWGKTLGINARDPAKPEDVAWVHAQTVPADVIKRTTQIYRYIFWRLTGMKLERFQREEMRIKIESPKMRIEIVAGSESDRIQMLSGLHFLANASVDRAIEARRHVVSCHRNPDALAQYARDVPDDCIIIAGAGMAAALPGVLKALLVKEGKGHIPVIGVAFEGKNEAANQAARLSIEQLPGQPVLLKPDGSAYFGQKGFVDACRSAVEDEFLPATPAAEKPAQFNLPLTEVRP